MATITASPNPVGFYTAGGQQDVTVTWDTEGGFNAIVYVAVGGLIENPMPNQRGGGAQRGTLTLRVTYPLFYYLSLKRADNKKEIAHVTVTTFDLRAQLAEDFSQAYLPQLRPQVITHLVVKPGVDTVRISFRTTRPTIPKIELHNNTGAWVDDRFPVSGGLRTSHQVTFGFEKPLALDTEHTFTIEASGATGNKKSPNKTVVTGEFVTGTRNVDVMFETLDVHDDGDPGARGAGEFRFGFGAGDANTRALMGTPVFWPDSGRVNISDDDPPIDLGKIISIAGAPRRLWLQVNTTESDQTLAPWEASFAGGVQPAFDGETGSSYHGSEASQEASVTTIVNLGNIPGRRMIPFEMKTGDFPVDFVVTGHLGVNAFVGAVLAPKMTKSGPLARASAFLTEPGSISRLAVSGAGDRSELVALGADGALYHRSLAPQFENRSEGGGWTRIELAGRGTPVVVASIPGMLDVIDLNEDGSVLHCGHDLQKSRGGKWRKLGGKFREIHPVVSSSKGRDGGSTITLFGIGDDGLIHVRDVHAEGQSWDPLGDQPIRAVAAVSAAGAGASLFAVGDDGRLVRCSRRNGRWRAEPLAARVPGESPTQLLTAVAIDQLAGKEGRSMRRDLVIAAMSEDHRVRMIRWPDYPAGAPETRWKELGSVQELVVEEAKSAAGRSRGTPKKAAPKRRASSSMAAK